MKAQRLDLITEFVNKHGYCSNELISENLNIPLTTLRRDLDELDKISKIIRIYGGAKSILNNVIYEQKLDEKLEKNITAKKNIAKKALDCIKENEIIFIDAGSTTLQLAKLIKPNLNLKIYTNSIENAIQLSKNNVNNINLIPGRLKNATGSIVGVDAISYLDNFHFDAAFIGVNAVDEEFNFYTTDTDEATIKKKIIEHSTLPFALIDSSKLNSISIVKFSSKNKMPIIHEEY
ncbi:DeoR/GlpR family DNA-binding transcription regulator [Spiroplasma endosymbiont of Labia minor]|uniref:DeoR/GlpR family DNA-binding transcription regulator n=1 Tax=Spiroplasma endosymbiont of Labia minor TaxID=3066305 RepID=UPI0030D2C798